ncbi:hypothetical protein KW830_05580 [Comamonas sp. CMM03]|uniref:YqkE family protein n=1 Tax=Comamonas sp. CMM03 TaxID=2854781 RepID=UPI001C44708F|nr:YqkE family protein [Comamonas sp. CMM03]MBV7417923.1 hypothetical protein [Comamonas sp. CMM03]
MGRILGWIGALFTIAYLGGLAWLTHGRWPKLQELPLNELGDFLAGSFGPLAILWLVLGYFQQGIELRQNSEALHLQAAELKNSVEQQTILANVARSQLEAELESLKEQREKAKREEIERKRRAQPSFTFSIGGSHGSESQHTIKIINYGHKCTNFRIFTIGISENFSRKNTDYLDQNSHFSTVLTLPRHPKEKSFYVRTEFIDGLGDPGIQLFRADIDFSSDYGYGTLIFTLVDNSDEDSQDYSE